MKNFSTAARITLCALAFCAFSPLPAPAAVAQDAVPVTPASCAFLPNAPDQHIVVKGDTLWDISGRFLKNPWCWPQVWGLNREEIRNPHWIYPGQVIIFDRAAGRLRIGGAQATEPMAGQPNGTVRLSPQARQQSLDKQPIPAIRPEKIEPFLSQPLIVSEDQLKDAPVIMSTPEGRVYLSRDDLAYVRGDLKGVANFQAFRPGKPLRDPDTGKVIGYEARYLGMVRLDREAREKNEAHRFVVTESREEMGVKDRLLPMPVAGAINYMPHAPLRPVKARIVSTYDGGTLAGKDQVVAINRGGKDGLDVGAVLELQRYGQTVRDSTDGNRKIKLPDLKYGTLFIFRVFDRISYGLIMQATDTTQAGDIANSPE